jgi:outer membrane protein assembly factor BamE (lipoprotein component of BamABCDE complex)
MKKLVIVLLFAFVLATLFASCKTKKCPTYEDEITATTMKSSTYSSAIKLI